MSGDIVCTLYINNDTFMYSVFRIFTNKPGVNKFFIIKKCNIPLTNNLITNLIMHLPIELENSSANVLISGYIGTLWEVQVLRKVYLIPDIRSRIIMRYYRDIVFFMGCEYYLQPLMFQQTISFRGSEYMSLVHGKL